jgi:hypothetical protein
MRRVGGALLAALCVALFLSAINMHIAAAQAGNDTATDKEQTAENINDSEWELGELPLIYDTSTSITFINKTVPDETQQGQQPAYYQYSGYIFSAVVAVLLVGVLSALILRRKKKQQFLIPLILFFFLYINFAGATPTFDVGQWNRIAEPLTYTISRGGSDCYNDDSSCYNPDCSKPSCKWGCCKPDAEFNVMNSNYYDRLENGKRKWGWNDLLFKNVNLIRGSVFKASVETRTAYKCTTGSDWQFGTWSGESLFETSTWKGCCESGDNDCLNNITTPYRCFIASGSTDSVAGAYNQFVISFQNRAILGLTSALGWNVQNIPCSRDPRIPGPPTIKLNITHFFVPAKPILLEPGSDAVLPILSKPNLTLEVVPKGDGYKLSLYKKIGGNWQSIVNTNCAGTNGATCQRVTENPDSNDLGDPNDYPFGTSPGSPNNYPYMFNWSDYDDSLNSQQYADGLPAGKYNYTITSCSYMMNDVYDCFDDEPTESRVFKILPEVKIRVSDADGSNGMDYPDGGETDWYNINKKVEPVCNTGDTNNACDGAKLYIYEPAADGICGSSCPSAWGSYTQDPATLQSTACVCAAGFEDDSNDVMANTIVPLKVKIEKLKPWVHPRCANPDSDFQTIPNYVFSLSFSDTRLGLTNNNMSGILLPIKYCNTTLAGTCTPNQNISTLHLTCDSPPTEGCSTSWILSPSMRTIYNVSDNAGNSNTTDINTTNIRIDINFPNNNTWNNTNQTVSVTINSTCANINWVGNCTTIGCNPLTPLSPPLPTNMENIAGITNTMLREYFFSQEGEVNVTYGANHTFDPGNIFTAKNGSIVKIDKTPPIVNATWSDLSELSDEPHLAGNAIVISVNDSKSSVNSVSGVNIARYCISTTQCVPNSDPTILANLGYFKNYSIDTTGLSPGNYYLKINATDNAGNEYTGSFEFSISGDLSGTINYQDGFWNQSTVGVTVTDTTPVPPGPAENFDLKYKTATLSPIIGCGTYGLETSYLTNPPYPFPPLPARSVTTNVIGLLTGCYKYTAYIYKSPYPYVTAMGGELKVDLEQPTIIPNIVGEIYTAGTTNWAKAFTLSWRSDDSNSGLGTNPVIVNINEDGSQLPPVSDSNQNNGNFDVGEQVGGFTDNSVYNINLQISDRAGNTRSVNTPAITIDTSPPACILTVPSTATPTFTVSWRNDDELGSGVANYMIGLESSSGIVDIEDYCNKGAGLSPGDFVEFNDEGSMDCPWSGQSEGQYTFTCYATDNVGNPGLPDSKTTTVNINPAASWLKAPRWTNSLDTIGITLGAADMGQILNFELKYDVNKDGIWKTDGIINNGIISPSLSGTTTVPFSIGSFGGDVNLDVNLTFMSKAVKTTLVSEAWPCPRIIVDPFNVFSRLDILPDCTDRAGDANAANRTGVTTIDRAVPEVNITLPLSNLPAEDIGYNIYVPTSNNLNLYLKMKDTISGVNSSKVTWSSTKPFTSADTTCALSGNTLDCGGTQPYTTDWAPKLLSHAYQPLSTVELTAAVADRAGNTNEITYYITDHPFVQPDANEIVLHVGENHTLGLTARNLLAVAQKLTISLSGYPLARFTENQDSSLEITLQPGRINRTYVSIHSEVPGALEQSISQLTITATSDIITTYTDVSNVRIVTVWPSSFSTFGQIAAILSVILSLVVFTKIL